MTKRERKKRIDTHPSPISVRILALSNRPKYRKIMHQIFPNTSLRGANVGYTKSEIVLRKRKGVQIAYYDHKTGRYKVKKRGSKT